MKIIIIKTIIEIAGINKKEINKRSYCELMRLYSSLNRTKIHPDFWVQPANLNTVIYPSRTGVNWHNMSQNNQLITCNDLIKLLDYWTVCVLLKCLGVLFLVTDVLKRLVSWDELAFKKQLPLQPGSTTCISFTVHGLSNFLSPAVVHDSCAGLSYLCIHSFV